MVNDQIRIKRALEAAVERLDSIDRGIPRMQLADALVFVQYSDSSTRAKEHAIPALLQFLRDLPDRFAGEVQPDALRQVDLVRLIRITRGSYPPGPHFQVDAVRSIANPLVERIAAKWSKSYQTSARRELLAYYHLHPAPPPSFWFDDLNAVVAHHWQPEGFERLWVFDVSESQILATMSPRT